LQVRGRTVENLSFLRNVPYAIFRAGSSLEVCAIRRKHLIDFAAALAVLILLQVLINHFYLRIPVTLAGERIRVSRDMTVTQLLTEKQIRLSRGNLLDVKRQVLRRGGGKAAYVLVDGKRAAFSSMLRGGDSIAPRNGDDVVEPVVTRRVSIPPQTKIVGEGRYLAINALGVAGTRLEHLGALSKIVTKRQVIKRPIPTVLVKTDEPPPKMIALTFDDGPGTQTLAIADALKREAVPATFFLLGQQVKKYPAIAKRLVDDGHVVGNHSFDHSKLTRLDEAGVQQQLAWTQSVIMRAAKRKPYWMRPPGGHANPVVLALARKLKLHSINWDIDSRDWTKPGFKPIAQKIIREARPGAVVLMHDGGGDRTGTLKALPYIIRSLRQQGYNFVTLDDMYNISPLASRLPVAKRKPVKR